MLLGIVDDWYANPKAYWATSIFGWGPGRKLIDHCKRFFVTCWAFYNWALYTRIRDASVFFDNETNHYTALDTKLNGFVRIVECGVDKRIEFFITTREFCIFFSDLHNFFKNRRLSTPHATILTKPLS